MTKQSNDCKQQYSSTKSHFTRVFEYSLLLGLIGALIFILTRIFRSENSHTKPSNGTSSKEAKVNPNTSRSTTQQTTVSISGWVHDTNKNAIQHAQVCISTAGKKSLYTESQCTSVSEQGQYSIKNLTPGTYRVTAFGPEFIPQIYKNETVDFLVLKAHEERNSVNFMLEPGGFEVKGRVKNAGGMGIDKAKVRIYAHTNAWNISLQTNAQGEFAAWVPKSTIKVSAVADGFTEESITLEAPTQNAAITLIPESILIGRVIHAETNSPMEGVSIHIPRDTLDSVETDSNGWFRLTHLKPGMYKPKEKPLDLQGRRKKVYT